MNRPAPNYRSCRLLRAPRPERRADHRAGDRIGPGSDVRGLGAHHLRQPIDRTGPRRSAPRSPRRDERIRHVPTGRDLSIHENFRAAFHHSRGTYFRWYGDDDWLEPRMPSAPSRARRIAGCGLCTTVQQYYRDGHPLPVNDPVPVLGGVDSPDPGTRVRALAPPVPERRHLGIDPVYSLVRRDFAAQDRAFKLHPRRRLRLLVRDGAPRAVCPRAGGPGTSHASTQCSSIGISRNFFQREQSILWSRRRRRACTTRSRARVCVALVGSRRASTRTGSPPARVAASEIARPDGVLIADPRRARPRQLCCTAATDVRPSAQHQLGDLGAGEEA